MEAKRFVRRKPPLNERGSRRRYTDFAYNGTQSKLVYVHTRHIEVEVVVYRVMWGGSVGRAAGGTVFGLNDDRLGKCAARALDGV